MLILISPAKTLDFAQPAPTDLATQPRFLSEASQLISALRQLSAAEISALMDISDKLGALNAGRFQQWRTPFAKDNAKQALWAFQGDVYTGMAAERFSKKAVAFAQQHLRILSGLYGLLRPLDLMQAYRLEMGTAFPTARGKNLYQFWGDKITEALNAELVEHPQPLVINLASNEYFQVINRPLLRAEVITPLFKDRKNGEYKIISFFAKKARGMMSAFIIRQGITQAKDIQKFRIGGYRFAADLSSSHEWVFTRDEPR